MNPSKTPHLPDRRRPVADNAGDLGTRRHPGIGADPARDPVMAGDERQHTTTSGAHAGGNPQAPLTRLTAVDGRTDLRVIFSRRPGPPFIGGLMSNQSGSGDASATTTAACGRYATARGAAGTSARIHGRSISSW